MQSPLMAFFNIHYRHIHHILTFHMSGDTWPVTFYSVMQQQSQLPHGGSVADLLPGADWRPVLRCHHNSHGCTVN